MSFFLDLITLITKGSFKINPLCDLLGGLEEGRVLLFCSLLMKDCLGLSLYLALILLFASDLEAVLLFDCILIKFGVVRASEYLLAKPSHSIGGISTF